MNNAAMNRGVHLTMPLFREMCKNPRVAAVKNSSMPVQDIQMFKMEGGKDFVVFNGPDEHPPNSGLK